MSAAPMPDPSPSVVHVIRPLLPRTRSGYAIVVTLLGVAFLAGTLAGATVEQALAHAASPGSAAHQAGADAPVATPTPLPPPLVIEDQLVNGVNKLRSGAGLPPLATNPLLMASAQAKLEDMQAKHYWAHFSPDGLSPWHWIDQAGYHYAIAGENLARGYDTTDALLLGWMESPEHRANIMAPGYSATGIAVSVGSFMGTWGILAVQHFAAPAR